MESPVEVRAKLWRRAALVCCILLLGVSLADAGEGAAPPSLDLDGLTTEIQRIAEQADNTLGLSVLHLESGRNFAINGDERFPLASTYKVAMAGAGLRLVDRGVLALDQMIEIPDSARVVSSLITQNLPHPGVSLSLANVMDLMLRESDNTATDVFLETIGGPAAVNAWLKEVGIEGLRVDRSTAELLQQFAGLPKPGPGMSYMDQWEQLGDDPRFEVFYTDASTDAYQAFLQDPQDQGTPRAMTELLARLWRGELLSPASTRTLRDIMLRCETGRNRLAGRLPEGTPLAHKTGTIAGTVNDVGVVTLPGDRGHLVISVFIENANGSREEHERVIADVARTAFDYFVLVEPSAGE